MDRYTNFIYLSDYPYLKEIARLTMRLHFLTSKNTWMGMFNTKGNQKRVKQHKKLKAMFNRRISKIIGKRKHYELLKISEPEIYGDMPEFLIMYKDAK